MKSLLKPFLDGVRNLQVVRHLPSYFDAHERRLVVQSIIIGVVVWAAVFALKNLVHWLFHTVLHWVEHAFTVWVLFIPLIIAGLIVAALVHYTGRVVHYRDAEGHIHELHDVEGDGLERAISLYYASEPALEQALLGDEGVDVRWRMPTFGLAARKFVATLATLGSGGSGGLEASVTLIGESLATGLFKPRPFLTRAAEKNKVVAFFWYWWRVNDPDDLQTAQLSGIAAAVATLLGAPFAAAFFATEVMYRRRPIIDKLVYSLVAALTAFFLTAIFSEGHTALFSVEQLVVPPFDWRYYAILVLMGVMISLVSVYFSRMRASIEEGFHHRQPNVWKRHLIGVTATGFIALAVHYGLPLFAQWGLLPAEAAHVSGLELVLGPGEGPIDAALAGELIGLVAVVALVAKLFATLITIGAGGSAGLLVPSIYFGTMVAAALAAVVNRLGYEIVPMTLVIPAITASLVSIVNVPLAAILLVVELFGGRYMIPALVVLVVTSIFAHENSIYRTQRQRYTSRQILPGFSTRRVLVPPAWEGETIISLNIRHNYDLNVIGLMEIRGEDGLPHINLDQVAVTDLESGDLLVVMGQDERLDEFEAAVYALSSGRSETENSTAPATRDTDPAPDNETAVATPPPAENEPPEL